MSHNQAKPHDMPPASGVAVPLPSLAAGTTRELAVDGEPAADVRQTWREWFFRSERIRGLLSFQVSLLVHCAVLIVLGLMAQRTEVGVHLLSLVIATERTEDEPLTIIEATRQDSLPSTSVLNEATRTNPAADIEVRSPLSNPVSGGATSHVTDAQQEIPIRDLLVVSTAPGEGGLQGRKPQNRARLVAEQGGTEGSEEAVELGLRWLATHQRQDGSWWLDHRKARECECRDPGITETRVGATALALLPFLGAGYTHRAGPYRDVVQDGIDYLLSRIEQTQLGGDLREGLGHEMYSHGLATIVLCEAYVMTGDERLYEPAQSTIDFICNAQHSRGGWRYKLGQPGDTTVSGWQVMALKSARMAQLHVPAGVIENAKGFLNQVQDGRGAFYGYLSSGKEPGPTAVGLLLRMYLGWHHDDERLKRGVHYLAHPGPSPNDMYYNYYVTQVLHHFGGNYWSSWNEEMREHLIAAQANKGHELGSWFFPDPHGSLGGRHYTTAMCIMILEVYYRHMPLYGTSVVEFDF